MAMCTAAGVAQAAVFPYTNDFSSAGLPNTAPAASWSLSGGTFNNVSGPGATTTNTASEQITGVAGNDFVVTTHFTLNSVTVASNNTLTTVGFGIFGSASNFSNFYLIDWAVAGTTTGTQGLRILRQGGGTITSSTPATSDGGNYSGNHIPLGTEFLLKVTGTYSGSTLSMTFGVWDSTGTTQIGGTATATDNAPLTGTFFGFRDRDPGNSSTYNISFNDFKVVAVPEPASLGVIGMAGLPLLRRRRGC
jgi:hypothetical protein